MSPVLLCLHSFVVASSTFHKDDYFSGYRPFLHTHCCSSWRQPPCFAMFLHLLPHFSLWCRFLLPFLPHVWTLPLLVFFLSVPKTLHLFYHYFLSPYLPHSALHYTTFQHFKPITPYRPLLLLFFIPTLLGKVPKPLTLPTNSSPSAFQFYP